MIEFGIENAILNVIGTVMFVLLVAIQVHIALLEVGVFAQTHVQHSQTTFITFGFHKNGIDEFNCFEGKVVRDQGRLLVEIVTVNDSRA